MPLEYNPLTKQFDLQNFTRQKAKELEWLGSTSEPMTIYVSTSGSDTIGNGSLANPYATVGRAYETIPRCIRHKCKILIESGLYADGWPRTIDPVFYDDGSLSIVGVGEPTVSAGPFTVASITVKSSGLAVRLNVTGMTWTVDEFCGQFIRVKTGTHVGAAYYVMGNGTNYIDVSHYLSMPDVHALDTIEIINPSIKILAPDGASFSYIAPVSSNADPAKGNIRFVLHNIWIDASSATSPQELITFSGPTKSTFSGMGLSFVRFDIPTGGYGDVDMSNAYINVYTSYDPDFMVDGETGLLDTELGSECVGAVFMSAGGRAESLAAILSGVSYLSSVNIIGTIGLSFANAALSFCAVGNIMSLFGHSSIDAQIYLGGQVGVVGMDLIGGETRIDIYGEYASQLIRLREGAKLSIHANGGKCSPTNVTGQAVDIGPGSIVTTCSSLANFVGAGSGGGAYIFAMTGTKSATWPGSNKTGATDSLGAFIARLD